MEVKLPQIEKRYFKELKLKELLFICLFGTIIQDFIFHLLKQYSSLVKAYRSPSLKTVIGLLGER